MYKQTLKCFILFLSLLNVVAGDELHQRFVQPPDETKPYCYWYWLNGDVSKEGITKDLEAMSRVGIQLAMIGNIGDQRLRTGKNGRAVGMYSEEWYDLTLHAFKEAERLSIELMPFNAPGWSQSGGPWITPERSMRRVEWVEYPGRSGRVNERVRAAGVLPSQDIAVLALPADDSVTLVGQPAQPDAIGSFTLEGATWIWERGSQNLEKLAAGTVRFKYEFSLAEADWERAEIRLTADNQFRLEVNGVQIGEGNDWQTIQAFSMRPQLKAGKNVVTVDVTNLEKSPAGLAAAIRLVDSEGQQFKTFSDKTWLSSPAGQGNWQAVRELARFGKGPWRSLKDNGADRGGKFLVFEHAEPFTARGLIVHGRAKGVLYAILDGARVQVADINANGGQAKKPRGHHAQRD